MVKLLHIKSLQVSPSHHLRQSGSNFYNVVASKKRKLFMCIMENTSLLCSTIQSLFCYAGSAAETLVETQVQEEKHREV